MLESTEIERIEGNAKPRLIFFDTTLRDGEQSPGVTLTLSEKVDIAKQLSKLGIDVLEAGFPAASVGDFDSVRAIAAEVGSLIGDRKSQQPIVVCGLSRAIPKDILRCYDAIKEAQKPRIHTFLATSDIHLKYKLKISRERCVEQAVEAVKLAKSLCSEVEFSPEDAGRSDKDFLCHVLSSVIEAGATTLNIPDTVGYNTPKEYASLLKYLIENTVGSNTVVWSTHCHDDLGLATANTLAGVEVGCRQVEVTINGIGERAGNTSFEEVCMTLYTHPTLFPFQVDHIETKQIYRVSQLVSRRTGMIVQPNKAIVGTNAFAHESGIHQDGVLKNKSTYEIIDPATVGVSSANSLVLGKHSGRNAFKHHLVNLGYDSLSDETFQSLFVKFKNLADTKRKVTDQDILALLDDDPTSNSLELWYKLDYLQCFTTCGDTATATVKIIQRVDPTIPDKVVTKSDAATSKSTVEAIFSAIYRIIAPDVQHHLYGYLVKGVTAGSDALATVSVTLKLGDEADFDEFTTDNEDENDGDGKLDKSLKARKFLGSATDPDVLLASANAYVNAINRIVTFKKSL